MDYTRYGNLGVGSLPQLLSSPSIGNTGLVDHSAAVSSAAQLPVASSNLLPPPHQPHPSLLFHYGVSGKPPSLPPHLLPSSVPTSVAVNSSCNTIITSSNTNSSIPTLLNSKPSSSNLGRTPTAVPSIALSSSITPLTSTTSGGSSRPASPGSSSFAAALRSLAKQATVPPGASDIEVAHNDINVQCSPKANASHSTTSNGPSIVVPSAPPVVTIAPTHSHPGLSELRKGEGQSAIGEMERNGPDEMVRGFQPYRAPDLPAVTVATANPSNLRPSLPIELAHAYSPYPSLYPYPLPHQYRLEEQLYLEQRFGLLRPPISPYNINSLSSLYPTSPYLSTRFPPELLPTSLTALHPSSALLHERLKLEEDMRHREYELELRRERELEKERERERERGREREREKDKERRHKEQELERAKEEKKQQSDVFRDRSPIGHSSGMWISPSTSSSVNKNSSNVSSSYPKKNQIAGISPQQAPRPLESRSSKPSVPEASNFSQNQSLKVSREQPLAKYDYQSSRSTVPPLKQRTPTIVRPFESTPTVSNISSIPPVTNATSVMNTIDITGDIREVEPRVHNVPEKKSIVPLSEANDNVEVNKSFSVWQPVRLSAPIPEAPPLTSTKKVSNEPLNNSTSITVSDTVAVCSISSDISAIDSKCSSQNLQSVQVSQQSLSPIAILPTEPAKVSLANQFPHFGSFLSPPLHLSHSTQVTHSQVNVSSSPSTVTAVASHSSQIPIATQAIKLTQPASSASASHLYNSQVTSSHSTDLSNISTTSQNSVTYPFNLSQMRNGLSGKSANFFLPTSQILPVSIPKSVSSSCVQQPISPSSLVNQVAPSNLATTITVDVPVSTTASGALTMPDSQNVAPFSPEKVVSPVSRLDVEEQRLRDLRATGMLASEAEETLLEESNNPTKTVGILCIKGPPVALDTSAEKMDFLCTFGLTTHSKADEVQLECCERRAKVLKLVSPSPPVETIPDFFISAKELKYKLAPGLNLKELPKMKGATSLLSDFSNKCKFLNNLGLHPQYSLSKEKGMDNEWKIAIEERSRRYNTESEDLIDQIVGITLKNLVKKHCKSNRPVSPINIPKESTESSVSSNLYPGKLSISLNNKQIFDSIPTNSTAASSLLKVEPSMIKIEMKSLLEDGLMSVGNLFSHEHDPLITSLSGIDKMIDHLVKSVNADGGSDNSALLEHIEEVRKSQITVCQTAQLVQEHVAKLISSKAQLETHRATLHFHLAAVTNILAMSNNHKNLLSASASSGLLSAENYTSLANNVHSTMSDTPTTSSVKSQTTAVPYTTLQPTPLAYTIATSEASSLPCNTNVTGNYSNLANQYSTSLTLATTAPAAIDSRHSLQSNSSIMSWSAVSSPFHISSNVPLPDVSGTPNFHNRPTKDKSHSTTNSTPTTPIKISSKIPSNPTNNLTKSHASSRQGISNLNKILPTSLTGNTGGGGSSEILGKFNGATNSPSLSQQSLYRPIHLSAPTGSNIGSNTKILGGSKTGSNLYTGNIGTDLSQLPPMFVSPSTTNNAIVNAYNNSKGVYSHSPNKAARSNKNPVGFTPYTKTTKVHTWLPN